MKFPTNMITTRSYGSPADQITRELEKHWRLDSFNTIFAYFCDGDGRAIYHNLFIIQFIINRLAFFVPRFSKEHSSRASSPSWKVKFCGVLRNRGCGGSASFWARLTAITSTGKLNLLQTCDLTEGLTPTRVTWLNGFSFRRNLSQILF